MIKLMKYPEPDGYPRLIIRYSLFWDLGWRISTNFDSFVHHVADWEEAISFLRFMLYDCKHRMITVRSTRELYNMWSEERMRRSHRAVS
jgi:hypothetical protein